MWHQTSLLGFLKPVDKKGGSPGSKTDKPEDTKHYPSRDSDLPEVTDTSIITDTPNASITCNDFQNSLLSPTFLVDNSVFGNSKQPLTTRGRRGPAHRRSSLTIRRQAELMGKYRLAVAFDGGPSNETTLERKFRQANASAKLRRGNYDSLNYAPIDQVTATSPISSLPTEPQTFSRRSEMLVSRALCLSSKPRRPFTEITKLRDCGGTLNKRFKSSDGHSKPCSMEAIASQIVSKSVKPVTPSSFTNLNSEEVGALDEIINLLEDNNVTAKLPVALTSRRFISNSKQEINKPFVNTIEPSNTEEPLSAKDSPMANSPLDDSLTQLNLSDWSVNGDLGEVHLNDAEVSSAKTVPPTDTGLYRGQITRVEKSRDHIMLEVRLENSNLGTSETNTSLEVFLADSWMEQEFHRGDTIQIAPGMGLSLHGHQITIRDSPEFSESRQSLESQIPAVLIQHPDFLVPCTKLVGSLHCTRRSVIEQFWPSGENTLGNSSVTDGGSVQTHPGFVMLLGSLLHELFQQLIRIKNPTVEDGRTFIQCMVTRADVILQAYAYRTTIADLRTILLGKIKTILNWIEVHHRTDSVPHSPSVRNPVIQEVLNVEENIWSTRFGLKGKIDLTALCLVPTSALKKTIPPCDSVLSSVVPIELKTGQPTYSVEHKGQVLLYLLMLFDRYGPLHKFVRDGAIQTGRFGWLVYLNDAQASVFTASNSGLIEPKVSEFRSLIQTRNRIASHLMRVTGASLGVSPHGTSPNLPWKPELPAPTKRLHICQMCPVQLACSLLSTRTDSMKNDCSSKSNNAAAEITSVSELLTTKKDHLTVEQVTFFLHWSHLCLLELADMDRLENVVRGIATCRSSGNSTGHEARPIAGSLRVVHSGKGSVNGQWITLFAPSADAKSTPRTSEFDPTPGDFVVVSSHDCKHVGVTIGTILSPEAVVDTPVSTWPQLQSTRNPILLSTEGPLPKWISSFRLDRYVTSKVIQLNLSNLTSLMEDSELSAYLRRLIIDRTTPTFSNTLSKCTVQNIRAVLKPMNMDQRTAILRVLMANDYVLIQGYPGTGKTQTLTALLKVLILLGRKILVVAHTHSAVDNLLGRLIRSGEKRVMRLGSADRVRSDLMNFCFENLLTSSTLGPAPEDPVDRCQRLVDEAVVVGCSALAASGGRESRHAALCRAQFDTVLIDEATQLLLPTAIGSLFCLRPKPTASGARFVLVGDSYQLPPLVQSARARAAGFECSLFSYLLDQKDHCAMDGKIMSAPSIGLSATKNPVIVELTLQYRMNRPILLLSNELTYAHAIRPADTKISEASLVDILIPDVSATTHSWAKRICSSDISDSVLFLDTHLWNICSLHLQNRTEAKLVVWILSRLFRLGLKAPDVGVIAPHRKQVSLIRELLVSPSNWTEELRSVEVNTVDQFQGRDKRLIVLSLTTCPRAAVSEGFSHKDGRSTGKLGLLDNLPRLTVALTRAKHKLILVGCSGTCTDVGRKHPIQSIVDSDERPLTRLFVLLKRLGSTECLPITSQSVLDI